MKHTAMSSQPPGVKSKYGAASLSCTPAEAIDKGIVRYALTIAELSLLENSDLSADRKRATLERLIQARWDLGPIEDDSQTALVSVPGQA